MTPIFNRKQLKMPKKLLIWQQSQLNVIVLLQWYLAIVQSCKCVDFKISHWQTDRARWLPARLLFFLCHVVHYLDCSTHRGTVTSVPILNSTQYYTVFGGEAKWALIIDKLNRNSVCMFLVCMHLTINILDVGSTCTCVLNLSTDHVLPYCSSTSVWVKAAKSDS